MTNAPQTAATADGIRQAMTTLAGIIRKFGDAPWPIMERLQRELKAIEDREKLLDDLLKDGTSGANSASFQ